jgi:hypothetical protein
MADQWRPLVERFNRNLRLLSRDLNQRYPGDPMVYRAHQRTMLVIAVSPTFVIEQVGPYLARYHDEIYNFTPEMETFFLENTFDSEMKAGVAAEKVDLVAYVIPKVKESAMRETPEVRESYRQLIIEMLDDYLEYTEHFPPGRA